MGRARKQRDQRTLEDHRVIFRNFSGRPGPFNNDGDRNFSVCIDDPKEAQELEKEGWNVKYLRPREDGDAAQAYLQISVSYNNFPPEVYMMTSRGRSRLTEDTIELLDQADYESVDVIIRPYNWEVAGKTGRKAYLKKLYVRIEEDDLDMKYQDVEDVPTRAGRTYE